MFSKFDPNNAPYKWSTAFEPAFCRVTRIDGSSIAAKRITDGREVYRDASQFKIANSLIQENTSEENEDQEEQKNQEDWREKILLNANPHSVQEETKESSAKEAAKTNTSAKADQSKQPMPAAATRPRHDRKRPEYLKDFVT